MRIMLDTNVIFSMFLFPSDQLQRLKCSVAKEQVILCTYIIDEVKEVVERKFPNRVKDIDGFLQSFPYEISYTPDIFDVTGYPEMRDPDDLPILVSAIREDVDIIISGDKDFTSLEIDRPEILTVTEYLQQKAGGERFMSIVKEPLDYTEWQAGLFEDIPARELSGLVMESYID